MNTTGYGALGVLAAGLDASTSTDWLASVQLPDGGLPMAPGGESDVFATAQALPALAGDSFLSLDPAVVGAAVVVPGDPDPTETPTETPTVTATPTTTPTLPPTGASTSSVAGFARRARDRGLGLVLTARRALQRA